MAQTTVQILDQSPVVFAPSGLWGLPRWPSGAVFVQFDPTKGLPRISDGYDLGSGVRNSLFEWRATTIFDQKPEESIGYFDIVMSMALLTSDGVFADCNVASGDKTLAQFSPYNITTTWFSPQNNLLPVGDLRHSPFNPVLPLSSHQQETASGRVRINSRYISVVWHEPMVPTSSYVFPAQPVANHPPSGQWLLGGGSGLHYFMLTPVPNAQV